MEEVEELIEEVIDTVAGAQEIEGVGEVVDDVLDGLFGWM